MKIKNIIIGTTILFSILFSSSYAFDENTSMDINPEINPNISLSQEQEEQFNKMKDERLKEEHIVEKETISEQEKVVLDKENYNQNLKQLKDQYKEDVLNGNIDKIRQAQSSLKEQLKNVKKDFENNPGQYTEADKIMIEMDISNRIKVLSNMISDIRTKTFDSITEKLIFEYNTYQKVKLLDSIPSNQHEAFFVFEKKIDKIMVRLKKKFDKINNKQKIVTAVDQIIDKIDEVVNEIDNEFEISVYKMLAYKLEILNSYYK